MSSLENRATPGAASHATSSQRFDAFIREAIEENGNWLEARDVTGVEWAHCMWHFVRLCRFHSELERLEPSEAADRVEESLRRHPEQCYDEPWSIFYNAGFIEHTGEPSWEAFVDQWQKVKRPVDLEDPLAEAVRLAAKVCELIPASAKSQSPSRACYRKFISIAGHLQQLLGPEQPIALPLKRLGGILGVTRQRVGQMRRIAVSEGYLDEVARYTPPGKGAGRAATYRFDLSRFPYFRKP